jgi:hypothetical protein
MAIIHTYRLGKRALVLIFTGLMKTWIIFFGHEVSHVPKKAQNCNRDEIQAYSIFHQIPVTGLMGAFLISFFRTLEIRA